MAVEKTRQTLLYLVVAYDIVCDRRRQRLAKLLGGYGERVNLSVFECELRPRQFVPLQHKIARIIDTQEDSVRFYELCGLCRGRILVLGQGLAGPERQPLEVI